MITRWRLFNFKSVRKDTELEFGPLTILAGANSSGKSTVIQSILLVAQTLMSKVSSKSVILNGPLVKLGQLDDIKSQGSESDQISIGWEIKPLETTQTGDLKPRAFDRFMWQSEYERVLQMRCQFSFDKKGEEQREEIAQLHPELFSMDMAASLTSHNGEDVGIDMNISRRPADFVDKQLNSEDLDYSFLRYEIKLSKNLNRDFGRLYSSATPIGVTVNHFLPEVLTVKYNARSEALRVLYSVLTERGARSYGHSPRRNIDVNVPIEVIQLLIARLGEKGQFLVDLQEKRSDLFGPASSIPLWEIYEEMNKIRLKQREEIRRLVDDAEFFEQISRAFISAVPDKFQTARGRIPEPIRESINYLQSTLGRLVRYLGPLRDEPKPLYPLAPSVDPMDVGLRGEYTAAVLNSHQNHQIKYLPTSLFKAPHVKREPTTRTLQTAVVDWLQYLSVAEEVQTFDKGKLGHELLIMPGQLGRAIDLTHVGVGVSQVLPILVLCLIAEPDSVLIFEQPELHLHPKVQTLLGDFFLSMALLGKQCIVETHSEYLISRLRYRVAASDISASYNSLVKTYFAKRLNGVSEFEPIEVNKYGAIQNWPEGFFDQSQREAEQILKYGIKKRKQEKP